MYCGKCGKKIPDGYEYCMYCGASLLTNKKPPNKFIRYLEIHKKPIMFSIISIICVIIFIYFVSPKASISSNKTFSTSGEHTVAIKNDGTVRLEKHDISCSC